MNSCQVLSGVSLTIFGFVLLMFTLYLFWMKPRKREVIVQKRRCNCARPMFFGRSRCYSCDQDLAQRACDTCNDQDYLTREIVTNRPFGPNAKLGYMDP